MRKELFPRSFTDKIASKADRRWVAQRETPAEIIAANEVREEKELHKQIFGLLDRHEIFYFHAPMFRASSLPPGCPDFCFVFRAIPFAWECKVGKAQPTPEQIETMEWMRKLGWRVDVIRSLEQAQELLHA